MFSGLNTNGGFSPCIVFYQRMNQCIKRENLPNKMCLIEGVDYIECIQKRKQYALEYKLSEELHKGRILELPHYDVETDTFISRFNGSTNAGQVFQAKSEEHQ